MNRVLLERAAVQRVQNALAAAGCTVKVRALEVTARTAQDAASALACPLGAIVKSLVFAVDGRPVMALVAGDRRCNQDGLRAALGLSGKVERADADLVRETTGYTIGGVPPVGHKTAIPIAIDSSLGRFEQLFAAAGHSHCVFPTTIDELARLTGAPLTDGISS